MNYAVQVFLYHASFFYHAVDKSLKMLLLLRMAGIEANAAALELQ